VSSGEFEPGQSRFWIVDASIGYRLSRRLGLVTVGAQNIFAREFRFQEIDPKHPLVQPDRFIYAKLTLAL